MSHILRIKCIDMNHYKKEIIEGLACICMENPLLNDAFLEKLHMSDSGNLNQVIR